MSAPVTAFLHRDIFLPDHIRDILQRKSSRDPTSQFASKLHALLTHTEDFPPMRDILGLAWVTEDEFRMHKLCVSRLMDIKLNTLNVNLRDLHFKMTHKEKNGWTRWIREGFTRTTVDLKTDPIPRPPPPSPTFPSTYPPTPPTGIATVQSPAFSRGTWALWIEVMGTTTSFFLPTETVIEKVADRFKSEEQPLTNAKDVIKAILSPTGFEPVVTFHDFQRFMAMFGPPQTVMVKIAALVYSSNLSGNWLTFNPQTDLSSIAPVGIFDEKEPCCLLVKHADRAVDKVFNDPTVDANAGMYLTDEAGKQYFGWVEYFAEHPIRREAAAEEQAEPCESTEDYTK